MVAVRVVLLVLGVVFALALGAVPSEAAGEPSCIDCYGNFCGDRTRCCGANGQMQADATPDTPACDDLDELCKAHDICTSMYSTENDTNGACLCDQIFKAGVEKAQANRTGFHMDDSCQVGFYNPNGGCNQDICTQGLENLFTLDTAVSFVGMRNTCTCAVGPLNGSVVTDVPAHCPQEQKCIEHVTTNRCEHSYIRLGWFPRIFRRRLGFFWWAMVWWNMWQPRLPPPPPECSGTPALPQPLPDPLQCSSGFITQAIQNIPDACNCVNRDLRCLLQRNTWRGTCKTHVLNIVRCATQDTRVIVIRRLLASNEFQSIDMNTESEPAGESVVERIHAEYWAPVIGVLFVALVSSLSYLVVRTSQYKARIALLNKQVGSRATGLSVVAGQEPLYKYAENGTAVEDSAAPEISTQ